MTKFREKQNSSDEKILYQMEELRKFVEQVAEFGRLTQKLDKEVLEIERKSKKDNNKPSKIVLEVTKKILAKQTH